jgi:hypothetical protein
MCCNKEAHSTVCFACSAPARFVLLWIIMCRIFSDRGTHYSCRLFITMTYVEIRKIMNSYNSVMYNILTRSVKWCFNNMFLTNSQPTGPVYFYVFCVSPWGWCDVTSKLVGSFMNFVLLYVIIVYELVVVYVIIRTYTAWAILNLNLKIFKEVWWTYIFVNQWSTSHCRGVPLRMLEAPRINETSHCFLYHKIAVKGAVTVDAESDDM